MRFDDKVAELFRSLPSIGPLFPYFQTVRVGDRAAEFHQRCVGFPHCFSKCVFVFCMKALKKSSTD